MADFNVSGQANAIDKIGSGITLGFGGTALNIASWLRELGHKPYLLTAIDQTTFTGQAIMNALRAGGLSRKYVIDDPQLSDSAFVGALSNGDLHFAVSYMAVSESGRLERALNKVVPRFDWVVFDCNLSNWMIGTIADICKDHGNNLIGAGTSETKIERLSAVQPHGLKAASMNLREASALMSSKEVKPNQLLQLRNQLNCSTLIVTLGEEGWYLVRNEVEHHPPPLGVNPTTTVGAGDAACAGLVNALVAQRPIPEEVNRVVARALRSKFPTTFSERTSAEVLPRIMRRRRMIRNGILSVSLFLVGCILTWVVEHGLAWVVTLFGGFRALMATLTVL